MTDPVPTGPKPSVGAARVRPPKQARTGLTSTGARKAGSKSARSRSREFALQAIYQLLIGKNSHDDIDTFTRDLAGFNKADALHFAHLLKGSIDEGADMDAIILPQLDRGLQEISPIERGILWIGVYEFRHCPDVPWRVVINECVELAKEFGGTDGHKYVNGVLNGLATALRAEEVANDAGKKSR